MQWLLIAAVYFQAVNPDWANWFMGFAALTMGALEATEWRSKPKARKP